MQKAREWDRNKLRSEEGSVESEGKQGTEQKVDLKRNQMVDGAAQRAKRRREEEIERRGKEVKGEGESATHS